MNVFWVINGHRLKKYTIFTVAALFAAGILFIEREAISIFNDDHRSLMSQTIGEVPEVIYSIQTDEKKLALTFDISWGSERPDPILDILEEHGVDATFFLSAPWAEQHPEIVERIKELGFEIGSHGYRHENYRYKEDAEIRQQISKAHSILSSISGQSPNLFRPPNGGFDRRVLQIAKELNYHVIQWHTDSNDWNNTGTEKIVQNVLEGAHPGDIILMHASDSSQQTHLALPQIIEQLKQEGYEFVNVTDLMTGAQSHIEEN